MSCTRRLRRRRERAFVDIDSLLRPVYGYAKQGASYGFTKIAGKQVLRKGLSPLATTISTDLAAPIAVLIDAGRAVAVQARGDMPVGSVHGGGMLAQQRRRARGQV